MAKKKEPTDKQLNDRMAESKSKMTPAQFEKFRETGKRVMKEDSDRDVDI